MNDAPEPDTASSDDRLPLCADPIAAWLVHHGGSALESRELLDQLCQKLMERGLRLLRVVVGVPTLHPQIVTRSLTWQRGRGIGVAILKHIVAEARARGYRRLSLETGSMAAFAPARALYAGFGFSECAPFDTYKLDPNSVFMALDLATP